MYDDKSGRMESEIKYLNFLKNLTITKHVLESHYDIIKVSYCSIQ